MNPIIYLSCLVLVCTVYADQDQEFNSEKNRLWKLYGDPSTDEDTKIRNVPDLVKFLDKYADRLDLTPERRRGVAEALRKYKEEKAKQVTVDGVESQGGGFWGFFVKTVLIHLGIELAAS